MALAEGRLSEESAVSRVRVNPIVLHTLKSVSPDIHTNHDVGRSCGFLDDLRII